MSQSICSSLVEFQQLLSEDFSVFLMVAWNICRQQSCPDVCALNIYTSFTFLLLPFVFTQSIKITLILLKAEGVFFFFFFNLLSRSCFLEWIWNLRWPARDSFRVLIPSVHHHSSFLEVKWNARLRVVVKRKEKRPNPLDLARAARGGAISLCTPARTRGSAGFCSDAFQSYSSNCKYLRDSSSGPVKAFAVVALSFLAINWWIIDHFSETNLGGMFEFLYFPPVIPALVPCLDSRLFCKCCVENLHMPFVTFSSVG